MKAQVVLISTYSAEDMTRAIGWWRGPVWSQEDEDLDP